MPIHPTAVVDSSAKVPASCSIGPFCTVGADVELGENCELISHVSLRGPSRIGANNRFYPFSSIGDDPQDLTFDPVAHRAQVRLEMGDNNTVREFVTINRGTIKGGGVTRIGNNCLIMAYAHIAHDCLVGDHVIMANAATLAGHVTVEDWAGVGALSPVHQYCRVGAHSYMGGGTVITQDVLPYSKTSAVREVHAYGVNAVGLERRGFSKERVQKIQKAFKILLASKLNTSQALEKIKTDGELMSEDVEMLVKFIESAERGVVK